jgi:hypothetical protein
MVALTLLGFAWAGGLPETLASVNMHEAAYVELMSWAEEANNPIEASVLHFRAAETLWDGELWDTASLHFSRLERTPMVDLGWAYTHYRSAEPIRALQSLAGLTSAETYYLAGWCYLELGQAQAAYDSWALVSPDSMLSKPSEVLRENIVGTWDMTHRSPAFSGAMSAVLPGAGQLYAGNAGDAVSALLVNGLLAALNWQLVENQLWPGVGLVGVIQLGFYGGNILAAVNSAHKYNRLAWDEKLNPIRKYAPRVQANGSSWFMAVESPPSP